jgi:hypothetical protein
MKSQAGPQFAGCTESVLGKEMDIEQAKLYVQIVGLVGTFSAAALALRTFLRGEQWKRAEFLAKEMKEFLSDKRVQNALLLIDWGTRTIPLLDDSADNHGRVLVSRELQTHALLPHTLVGDASSDLEQSGPTQASTQRFTIIEAAIRDCYDAFLDGLERLSSYTQTGLVDLEQLRPYLQYWIDDIHCPAACDEEDAAWTAVLLTYIAYYRFSRVQWLFRAFDRSIDVSDPPYRGFLEKMRDQQLAKKLAAEVGARYTWPQHEAKARTTGTGR